MIACQLALALLIGSLDVALLKGWVLRPRPDLYAAQQLNIPMPELLSTSHSFPSGHTLVAAAAAVIFAATLRDWRAIVFFLFVIFVGVSRIYQGFHWPTDIIGSIVLGVVAGLLALWVCNQAPVKRLLSTDVGILEPEQVRQKTE